jgi:transketolase
VRKEFAEALIALADEDEKLVLLTGDLGYMVLEPFAERFPQRFINVGVAEQNLLGLATGLAEAGHVPFVYSIATFASMRPYEFLRNGAVLHSLPVRVVGVGGGLDYGHNGVTHYALEDIALMRAQPDLTVIAPADAGQTTAAVEAIRDVPGPLYLRLERHSEPVPGLNGRFAIGAAQFVGDGEDVAFVAVGSCAREAVTAAQLLYAEGVHATVAVVSTFNPSPTADLASLLRRVPLVVSVEAHYPNGGLRSFVSEVIAEHECACRLVSRSVDEMPRAVTGSRESLFDRFGLSALPLADLVLRELGERLG